MENNIIWTDGIELALNEIKEKSVSNSDYHKNNYYFFKGYLKYFRIPTIILSGMNSVFSVGLQPYVSQGIISVLCCSISLICGIIASVELFLGIQNVMEKELIASKEFYILSSDIFKTLSVERQYRTIDGKVYLDNIHTKYCTLIEQSNLLNNKIENFKITNLFGEGINKLEYNYNKIQNEYKDDEKITIKIIKDNIKQIKQEKEQNDKKKEEIKKKEQKEKEEEQKEKEKEIKEEEIKQEKEEDNNKITLQINENPNDEI